MARSVLIRRLLLAGEANLAVRPIDEILQTGGINVNAVIYSLG